MSSATVLDKRALESAVNDASRRITLRGTESIVPLKFDGDGDPVGPDTPAAKRIFRRLTLNDYRFLKVWRESDWDIEAAVRKTGVPQDKVERLIRKLQCFRDEDAKVRALCEIPNPEWIAARHVENLYNGGELQDSQHKSLVELAKIEGAYKQQAPASQLNVFNINLTPEQEARLKPVFDTIAMEKSA